MLNLRKYYNQPDLKDFITSLEEWIIRSLHHFDIAGERRDGRVGIWVNDNHLEKKIAAIGVRVRKWVTFHGISLNINPNLTHYRGIVPCGLAEYGVTSFQDLGIPIDQGAINAALVNEFLTQFSKDV